MIDPSSTPYSRPIQHHPSPKNRKQSRRKNQLIKNWSSRRATFAAKWPNSNPTSEISKKQWPLSSRKIAQISAYQMRSRTVWVSWCYTSTNSSANSWRRYRLNNSWRCVVKIDKSRAGSMRSFTATVLLKAHLSCQTRCFATATWFWQRWCSYSRT